ncbi:MAG: PIN domain-containing protein [Verrucomicrobiaceae bacterium]|jgi:predicted nucleic acid-binding protein|nr:MAG: PIN domain-containing protein [Verrucomicrobiaceae bacterium]
MTPLVMNSLVIVDTSAWIETHRRDGSPAVKLAVRGLLDEFEAALCGPVEMEYLGGVRPEERERLQAWCNVLPYVRNDQKLWRKAAANFALLKKKGITAPWNDVLIATIALENGCRVYAVDKHFTAMAPLLGFHLYQPGYGGSYNPE